MPKSGNDTPRWKLNFEDWRAELLLTITKAMAAWVEDIKPKYKGNQKIKSVESTLLLYHSDIALEYESILQLFSKEEDLMAQRYISYGTEISLRQLKALSQQNPDAAQDIEMLLMELDIIMKKMIGLNARLNPLDIQFKFLNRSPRNTSEDGNSYYAWKAYTDKTKDFYDNIMDMNHAVLGLERRDMSFFDVVITAFNQKTQDLIKKYTAPRMEQQTIIGAAATPRPLT